MKSIKRKLSAVVLSAMLVSTQAMAIEFDGGLDTGLGKEHGGAVIDKITGGYVDYNKGNNSFDLNFNGDAHVNWGNLNIDKGESLNFNAANGANGLTILNTVNSGMSTIYGQINANPGIAKLIISNPNGVLFDGAQFTTAGDAMITTQPITAEFINGQMQLANNVNSIPVGMVQIKDSDFNVGGEFNILAPAIDIAKGYIQAKNGIKLVTENGQDYLAANADNEDAMYPGVRMEAVNIDGDVYIQNKGGSVRTSNGGTINGNVNVTSDNGSVAFNYRNNGEKLTINGNLNSNANGQMTFVRNADVKGNLALSNSGGFVDIGDVHVTGNADLKTTGVDDITDNKFNHFVHVIGETQVDGNLNVDSSQNIHIGGYDYDAQKLADGKLTVGGDLTAHAHNGHVMTTIDTSANKISLKSDTHNVLTDGKATLTANQYDFSANGYIGGLQATDGMTVDQKVLTIMEKYYLIPETVGTPAYINIAGGEVTGINTPTGASAYIASSGDMTVTGANAGNIYLTSYGKDINITGNNVHANNITVGGETDKLKVDYPSRDYNLTYTNIRDNAQVNIKGNEEITYNLTNGENGYNRGQQIKGENTYLVGPEGPDGPGPGPTPTPDPDPNESAKVLRSYERQPNVTAAQPYTPIAYAADLDEDQQNDKGIRKNVDGSVTVVKAFPMID